MEPVVIENVGVFQLLRVASALAIEIDTGMRHSGGSVMLLAKQYCGSPKQTKRGVLRDYTKWLETQLPGYEPNPAVLRALKG